MPDREIKSKFRFPTILNIKSHGMRLIDLGLLPNIASQTGFQERYNSGKTSHTIHVWWARRPHISMRLLTFASLFKSNNRNTNTLLSELVSNKSPESTIPELLRDMYGYPPKLIDLFGGGGTIAIESGTLGASTYSIDSNELSIFIQKSHIEFMQNDEQNLLEIIRRSGERILKILQKESEELFPERNSILSPLAYLWTYSKVCPKCQFSYFLSKRPFLDQKSKNVLAIRRIDSSKDQILEFLLLPKSEAKQYGKSYLKSSVHTTKICPNCSADITISTKKTQDHPVAIVCKPKESGVKEFKVPEPKYFPPIQRLTEIEKLIDSKLNIKEYLTQHIPVWNGITNITIYGIETYRELYTSRQRILLKLLIYTMMNEYQNLSEHYSTDIAKAVITPLTALIDQLVDWNSRITMWISQNLQPGRAFSGPGIPMYWDFCEVDPLAKSPSNLWDKLNRIIRGLESLPKLKANMVVQQANAQRVPFESGTFDAVVTDPPYYDNLFYTVLADFFYVWKLPLIRMLDLRSNLMDKTSDTFELTASTRRNGSNAHNKYRGEMVKVLIEVNRLLKEDGILSFIFSHSSFLGWEAVLYAFQQSEIYISSVQPLNIERKHRPRGMNANSVDVCMTFVGRKASQMEEDSLPISLKLLPGLFKEIQSSLIELLWSDYDIALTQFANGIGIFCNLKAPVSDEERKKQILFVEDQVRVFYPGFKIKLRRSL